MLLDNGTWHSYRLPKASHCYDGAHGWNTEWPRIRDIGETSLLMTMHGMFWRFPKTFSAANSTGIAPRSSYIRVIGDFTRWQDKIVLGCDDTATNEFFNTRLVKGKIAGPGQSQSNLWFLPPSRLDQFGPPIGRGAIWINDPIKANTASEPFLFSGFDQRTLHLAHNSSEELTFTFEIDKAGNNVWTRLRDIKVPANGYAHTAFTPTEKAAWVRIKSDKAASKATAFLQFANTDQRQPAPPRPKRTPAAGGLIWARGEKRGTLLLATSQELYELDATLALKPLNEPKLRDWMQANLAPPKGVIEIDAASVIYIDEANKRWRLPKGDPVFNTLDVPVRIAREVSTERDLLNLHGTFYELPSNNAGGIAMVRPISTHNLSIYDFCSWRGLTVLSGLPQTALPAGEFITSKDGKQRLWLGASDDLWQFGKPLGQGGPWSNTSVQANVPSDPYLLTGYDQKVLTLSHAAPTTLKIQIEIDLTGFGLWVTYETFNIAAGKPTIHRFPAGFNAYWLRATALADATATAQLTYS